jgi:hypothetical protein
VGCAAGDSDSGFALEQIQELLPAEEYGPWERKWRERCAKEPLVVLEAISDTKAMSRTVKIRSYGATIFKRANELLKPLGRALRILSY